MSVNKIYLRTIDELKKEYEQDQEKFIRRMRKADILLGSNESVEFVKKINEKHEKGL